MFLRCPQTDVRDIHHTTTITAVTDSHSKNM